MDKQSAWQAQTSQTTAEESDCCLPPSLRIILSFLLLLAATMVVVVSQQLQANVDESVVNLFATEWTILFMFEVAAWSSNCSPNDVVNHQGTTENARHLHIPWWATTRVYSSLLQPR